MTGIIFSNFEMVITVPSVAEWQLDTPRGALIAIASGLAWVLSFTTYPRVQGA